MRHFLAIFFFVNLLDATAQQAWPGGPWSGNVNLTPVMDPNGLTELSGLHWNPVTSRLYTVQGTGRLRILQYNPGTGGFSQVANKAVTGGPEGITQVNFGSNTFYTIDEDNYEIRRYDHTANFGTVNLVRKWNLLLSPMQDTGNQGPEGIAFVPDASLAAAGFISQQTGAAYTSAKGMGGLMFIAHQDQGMIWVYDVNPSITDDFIFVGKYRTARTESCDLAFDRTTGMLYILHNLMTGNTLEVSNLSTVLTTGGERQMVTHAEYSLPDAGPNNNMEGVAIAPKCPGESLGAWLCRDVESSEPASVGQDALRFFPNFTAEGDCSALGVDLIAGDKRGITVYPNPANDHIIVSFAAKEQNITQIRLVNSMGQAVLTVKKPASNSYLLDVSALSKGIYFLEVLQSGNRSQIKWVKQ